MKISGSKPNPLTHNKKMFCFHVLRSKKDGDLYFGYSANLKQRLNEHNLGKIASTKNRKPFDLVYYEAYKNEDEARNRKLQIKKRAGALIGLKRRIKKSISSEGV